MRCPVSEHASIAPQAIFLRDEISILSFEDADRKISQIYTRLQSIGLKPGDRIGILARNSINSGLLIFAALRSGISFVPINLFSLDTEISEQCKNCRVNFVFCDANLEGRLKGLEIALMSLEELMSAADLSEEIAASLPIWNEELEGCVIFTSATQGQAKGIVLSIGALAEGARSSNFHTGLSKEDTWLVSLPLYHVSGLSILVRTALVGAGVYLIQDLARRDILNLIEEKKITHLSLVPSMLNELLEIAQQENVKSRPELILLGGDKVPLNLATKASQLNWPVMYSYGMTETAAHISCSEVSPKITQSVPSGKALAHCRISIRDESGAEVPALTVGQIYLKSTSLFSGYIQCGEFYARNEEWYATQDIGQLDSEGNLFVLGRLDSVIISGGEKINPIEIEQLSLKFPGVQSAVVVSLEDVRFGNRPVLFIKSVPPNLIKTSDFQAFLKNNLPAHKMPRDVLVLKDIPFTAGGKIDYRQLRLNAQATVAE